MFMAGFTKPSEECIMAGQSTPKLSVQDYLALERTDPEKHQYIDGEIFLMGGASATHNLITANIVGELRMALKSKPCRVYANDLRVKVNPAGLYTYPDVVVTCGEERFDDQQEDTLLNPIVLVEVLSDSTEAYDRGGKFAHYRRLESLRDYVLVSQNEPLVECFSRQADQRWLLSEARGLEATLLLPSLENGLALAEVYAKVAF
jgi:Uma2 family endonuclease